MTFSEAKLSSSHTRNLTERLCHSASPHSALPSKNLRPRRLPLGGKLRPAGMRGKPTKRKRFAHEGTSTLLERKMRPRPRLRFWPTQRPCYRVSSSCRQYEVFGNFAWRSTPPRKRVTQSEKAPDCETERCPLPVAVAVGPACGGTAIGEPA